MRNKLVHEYFGIEVKIIWNTIQEDIPVFKKDILNIINDIEPQIPLKY